MWTRPRELLAPLLDLLALLANLAMPALQELVVLEGVGSALCGDRLRLGQQEDTFGCREGILALPAVRPLKARLGKHANDALCYILCGAVHMATLPWRCRMLAVVLCPFWRPDPFKEGTFSELISGGE